MKKNVKLSTDQFFENPKIKILQREEKKKLLAGTLKSKNSNRNSTSLKRRESLGNMYPQKNILVNKKDDQDVRKMNLSINSRSISKLLRENKVKETQQKTDQHQDNLVTCDFIKNPTNYKTTEEFSQLSSKSRLNLICAVSMKTKPSMLQNEDSIPIRNLEKNGSIEPASRGKNDKGMKMFRQEISYKLKAASPKCFYGSKERESQINLHTDQKMIELDSELVYQNMRNSIHNKTESIQIKSPKKLAQSLQCTNINNFQNNYNSQNSNNNKLSKGFAEKIINGDAKPITYITDRTFDSQESNHAENEHQKKSGFDRNSSSNHQNNQHGMVNSSYDENQVKNDKRDNSLNQSLAKPICNTIEKQDSLNVISTQNCVNDIKKNIYSDTVKYLDGRFYNIKAASNTNLSNHDLNNNNVDKPVLETNKTKTPKVSYRQNQINNTYHTNYRTSSSLNKIKKLRKGNTSSVKKGRPKLNIESNLSYTNRIETEDNFKVVKSTMNNNKNNGRSPKLLKNEFALKKSLEHLNYFMNINNSPVSKNTPLTKNANAIYTIKNKQSNENLFTGQHTDNTSSNNKTNINNLYELDKIILVDKNLNNTNLFLPGSKKGSMTNLHVVLVDHKNKDSDVKYSRVRLNTIDDKQYNMEKKAECSSYKFDDEFNKIVKQSYHDNDKEVEKSNQKTNKTKPPKALQLNTKHQSSLSYKGTTPQNINLQINQIREKSRGDFQKDLDSVSKEQENLRGFYAELYAKKIIKHVENQEKDQEGVPEENSDDDRHDQKLQKLERGQKMAFTRKLGLGQRDTSREQGKPTTSSTAASRWSHKNHMPRKYSQTRDQLKENLKNCRIEDFEFVGKTLGQGGYAIVRVAYHRGTRERYAIKTYNRLKGVDAIKVKSIKDEIDILKKQNHPNQIKYITDFENLRHVHLVMDLAGEQNMRKYITQRIHNKNQLTESELKFIFKQILSAIGYLHKNDIVHQDIKAENIVINEKTKEIKLVDFGFSQSGEQKIKALNIFCGTPCYMAPELFNRKIYDGRKVDVWAMAVLFYFIITAEFPFKGNPFLINDFSKRIGKSDKELGDNVNELNWNDKLLPCSMKFVTDLLKNILVIDGKLRPTCDKVSFFSIEFCRY